MIDYAEKLFRLEQLKWRLSELQRLNWQYTPGADDDPQHIRNQITELLEDE